MTGEFDPAQYKDEYREALETIIEAKVEGKETVEVEAPEESGKLDRPDGRPRGLGQRGQGGARFERRQARVRVRRQGRQGAAAAGRVQGQGRRGRTRRRRPSPPGSARPPDGRRGTLHPMPLEEYRRKRDFAKTPEPPPGTPGAARRARPWRALRGPAPSRDAAPLRLPARGRRRPRVVGRAEGPDARFGPAPDGDPRRGPPDRVLRLRGRHPVAAVRRGRRDRVGLGHLGGGGADRRRADGDPRRRAQVHPRRPEAQGPLHDRPDQRSPAQGRRPGGARLRGRPGRAVAAHPQARTRRPARLGRRGPPAERQDRPDERRRQGRPRRRCGTARRRPPRPRST